MVITLTAEDTKLSQKNDPAYLPSPEYMSSSTGTISSEDESYKCSAKKSAQTTISASKTASPKSGIELVTPDSSKSSGISAKPPPKLSSKQYVNNSQNKPTKSQSHLPDHNFSKRNQPRKFYAKPKVNSQVKFCMENLRNSSNMPKQISNYILSEIKKNPDWDRFSLLCYKFTAMIRTFKQGKDPFCDKNLHLHRFNPRPSKPNSQPKVPGDKEQQKKQTSTSSMQKLYNRSKKEAIRLILSETSPRCKIPAPSVQKFFEEQHKTATPKNLHSYKSLLSKPENLNEDFIRAFSQAEISKILKKAKRTAPGEDRVLYDDLKNFDPSHKILTEIFNRCLREKKVPEHWKRAHTILLHKKGDTSDIKNWRPIALSVTISKVYNAIWHSDFLHSI
jgi:hypothetical protein